MKSNFLAQEFLPKETFELFNCSGLRFINPKILVLMEVLRYNYDKPIRINNWHIGGIFNGRCLRLANNKDYKQYSDHTFGNAIDFEVIGVSAKQVQEDCIEKFHSSLLCVGVTGMEINTPTWTHLSMANLTYLDIPIKNGIKLIKG